MFNFSAVASFDQYIAYKTTKKTKFRTKNFVSSPPLAFESPKFSVSDLLFFILDDAKLECSMMKIKIKRLVPQ